ncbi:aldose 1-epimerase family protein [Blautia obeum]|jgi:galactose mutarotase-like enzyme|uniref:Aldose 1-epimerase family protein n=2 Tax=Lachnospiraceae TaxID=186803 RepID=A0A411ZN74_9FIRM|nr:aldose 1-epimerase family protein [Blautia obeum]RGQ04257.1 aldose 1-epimerase family protein [Blautia obeum]RHB12131.1 aldose 1-epimerase family protein [Blautia obeum]RHH20129.1 aldose 1-epimerase family protein [Blautia obeum]
MRKHKEGEDMNYTISNEKLTLVVSSKGGEFQSVKDAEGQEYLWQGDAATWTDRGPNLFPYIGRMTEKSYKYQDTVYHMDIHGFLPYDEMELVEQKADSLTLRLVSSPETRKQYPFEFTLDITWKLEGEKITITYQVKNTDDKKMYFGIGGHPGFQIPIEKNLKFEDYRIDFGEDPKPRRILFSEDCFVLEEDEAFALEEGRYLNLEHNLFDDDAIVLKEMPREVTLESAKGSKKITVAFPDMDYLGIWHWPHVEVDYVCIEPWSSLPSRKNVVEDLEKQADLLSLESGQEYTNTWSITIKEK